MRGLTTVASADAALAAALEVAEPIRTLPAAALDRSVASGAAGLAVCFAELGALTGDGRDLQAAARYIRIALDQVAAAPLGGGVGLFAGLTGVAWADLHVARVLGEAADPDEDLDTLLAEALERRPWPGPWDLVSGLVGLGVYALARPHGDPPDLLGPVVRALGATVGPAWTTDSRLTFGPEADGRPDRYVDLGLAHGIAGAMALLATAAGRGCDEAQPVLASAVTHLLAHELDPADPGGRFPAAAWPGRPPGPSRVAWCYGDLGAAWALLAAADALDDPEAGAAGRRALAAAAARPLDGSGVVDAGLCHGTAGVALCLRRLAAATHDDQAATAAGAWSVRLLDEVSAGRLPASPGFLEGRAGVVLTLLAVAGGPTGWAAPLLLRGR